MGPAGMANTNAAIMGPAGMANTTAAIMGPAGMANTTAAIRTAVMGLIVLGTTKAARDTGRAVPQDKRRSCASLRRAAAGSSVGVLLPGSSEEDQRAAVWLLGTCGGLVGGVVGLRGRD
jgi:hypothetical protein